MEELENVCMDFLEILYLRILRNIVIPSQFERSSEPQQLYSVSKELFKDIKTDLMTNIILLTQLYQFSKRTKEAIFVCLRNFIFSNQEWPPEHNDDLKKTQLGFYCTYYTALKSDVFPSADLHCSPSLKRILKNI
jgi:hypothetical protein